MKIKQKNEPLEDFPMILNKTYMKVMKFLIEEQEKEKPKDYTQTQIMKHAKIKTASIREILDFLLEEGYIIITRRERKSDYFEADMENRLTQGLADVFRSLGDRE